LSTVSPTPLPADAFDDDPAAVEEISAKAKLQKLAVRVENLWIRYGKFVAVRGINLEIPHGEVFGFIGPNGAGKSSTIRVLATLQPEFDGYVHVAGLSVRRRPQIVREKIGYVPDFFGVYDDLTARE
jgi:ABC-2 type transport system ATP-binding protein